MAGKRLNAEKVLAELAKLRAALPPEMNRPRPRQSSSERMDARSIEEFEMLTIADALEGLADDIGSAVKEREQALFEQALDVYYAAVELSQNPEQAHLIEHVEKMRTAYEASYGHPIPSKEETERRRAGEKKAGHESQS